MRNKQEVLTESFEVIEDTPEILFALALNTQPLRRAYFAAVTGFDDRTVTKMLARLANAGAIAPTDGLLFRLIDDSLYEDIIAKIPPETKKTLHEKSLAFADEKNDMPPAFMIHHALGLGDYARAADILMVEIAKPLQSHPQETAAAFRECVNGLWAMPERDEKLIAKVGIEMMRRSESLLKPREFKEWVERLRAMNLGDEATAVLDEAQRQRAARKESEKAAEAAEKTATPK